MLEYIKWDKFLNVIDKAIQACKNSGQEADDHFPRMEKLVKIGFRGKNEIHRTQKQIKMSKLGSKKKPAIVRVQTEQRAQEVLALCNSKGWQAIVGIEPDKDEDISDVERLLNPPKPIESNKIARNSPCPCGSGKKYKKCCLH